MKPNQKYQFSLIIFKSWKYLTLSLCEINYLVRICVYTYILISYTRSYRRDTIFSTDGKNRWYFNWTVNGWRFFDIYRGMGYIALMTICPSKRCLPANWHCIRDILRYRSLIENASARSARVVCSKQRNNVEDRWIRTNGQDKNGWGMNRFHGSLLLNVFFFLFFFSWDFLNFEITMINSVLITFC